MTVGRRARTLQMQADIDAAFRRIPVAAEHRWACGVAFIVSGQARDGEHKCITHV